MWCDSLKVVAFEHWANPRSLENCHGKVRTEQEGERASSYLSLGSSTGRKDGKLL